MMEQTTFDSLCKEHYHSVWRYMAHRYKEQADDLTQEAFLRAQEYIHHYRADESAFKTWVITIGNNIATNWRVQARRTTDSIDWNVDVLSLAHGVTPETLLSAKQLAAIADAALEELKDDVRARIVEDREFNAYTQRHISRKIEEQT